MAAIGNWEGDVRDWRVSDYDNIPYAHKAVEVWIQSDGAWSGGDVERGGLGGRWFLFDTFDLRYDGARFDAVIAALQSECPCHDARGTRPVNATT